MDHIISVYQAEQEIENLQDALQELSAHTIKFDIYRSNELSMFYTMQFSLEEKIKAAEKVLEEARIRDRANAHLISAAPELLAALQIIQEKINAGESGEPEMADLLLQIGQITDDAISKTEGR